MVKRILLWKEQRRNKKLKCKLESIRTKLNTEKQRNRLLRKVLVNVSKENGILRDGWVTDYCDNCNKQVTILWDPEEDGISAFCPFCGEKLALCDSCTGPCDLEYGTGLCKADRREG